VVTAAHSTKRYEPAGLATGTAVYRGGHSAADTLVPSENSKRFTAIKDALSLRNTVAELSCFLLVNFKPNCANIRIARVRILI